MPETNIPTSITDKNAVYALVRFCFSVTALVFLSIADLSNDKDSIPTIVYLLIGGLNGVDVYNLVQKTKDTIKNDSGK